MAQGADHQSTSESTQSPQASCLVSNLPHMYSEDALCTSKHKKDKAPASHVARTSLANSWSWALLIHQRIGSSLHLQQYVLFHCVHIQLLMKQYPPLPNRTLAPAMSPCAICALVAAWNAAFACSPSIGLSTCFCICCFNLRAYIDKNIQIKVLS